MKKLLLVLVLFVFGCAGHPYKSYNLVDPLKDGYEAGGVGKVLKSENGVHVKRYGIRYSDDSTVRTKIGLYKVIIGDLYGLGEIYSLNRSFGFAGTAIFRVEHSTDWSIAKYRRYKYKGERFADRKLYEKIVKQKNLPNPFNIMPNYMLNTVESIAIYEDGKYVVIYVWAGTNLDDIGKLFGFVVKYKEN